MYLQKKMSSTVVKLQCSKHADCCFKLKGFLTSQVTQKQCAVVLLFTWIIATYMIIQPLKCIESNSEIAELKEKLNQEVSHSETLQQQNVNFFDISSKIRSFQDLNDNSGPMPEYENLRRRIYSNTKELWHYLSNQIDDAVNKDLNAEKIRNILTEVVGRKRSLLSDQEKLLELDGFSEWRQHEATTLSDLVQRRLHHLQNPPDCLAARKLVCDLNKTGGFGCQIHHLIYCLLIAYATERTLILNSKGWQYNQSGWENIFHPLSETCTSVYDDKVSHWPAEKKSKVIFVPIIEKISPMPKFLPPVIPQDLAHRIVRFNGDASSWWVGQMLKFILKPLDPFKEVVENALAKVDFGSPIVGVHIRRTDKGSEAPLREIKEYMVQVEDYYEQLEMSTTVDHRRVYIATDDPGVLEEARKLYKDYIFYGDRSIAMSAAVDRRNTPAALTGLLVDLHMLAKCDYIVCTFSSNVGRMAYELMQTNRADASQSFFSLDNIYYFCLVFALDRIAVVANKGGDNDISFEAGDQLGLIPSLHLDGYDHGSNKRTLTSGRIPWYKTTEHLMTYRFPVYKQVPMNLRTSTKHTTNG